MHNKRRITTNLKTKTKQNCQKIELYGSLTNKELKKKHSSRLVGGTERKHSESAGGGQDSPTLTFGKKKKTTQEEQ